MCAKTIGTEDYCLMPQDVNIRPDLDSRRIAEWLNNKYRSYSYEFEGNYDSDTTDWEDWNRDGYI